MKILLKAILISSFFVLLVAPSYADPVQNRGNFKQVFKEMRALAVDYELSTSQKSAIRKIILKASPVAMDTARQLLENRATLLELTRNQVDIDLVSVEALAVSQGQHITELIIWKEQLKADMRGVLDEDQLAFVDELVEKLFELRKMIADQING